MRREEMPDFIKIGSHAYALTLNLFLTGGIGLFFSILFFRYRRMIKRQDEEKRRMIEARERADAERHDLILESVRGLREELGDKSDILFQKVDDYCKENSKAHDKMKRNFWKHRHVNEEIFIREYEP
jgi:hypothetical protein